MTHWRSPDVSPLHHISLRDRLQNQLRPVSSVRRRASSFIQASIRTAPVPCSCTMAGTSPSASQVTAAMSLSRTPMGVAVGTTFIVGRTAGY